MSIATEIQRIQTAKADIKTAIENKGVEVGDGKIDTYAEKINQISGGGGDNHYDTFWDNFQANGARQNYSYAFYGSTWNGTIYKPKHSFESATSATSMFQASKMTKLGRIEMPKVTSFQNACQWQSALTEIETLKLSDECASFGNAFQGCSALVSITFESTISANINFQYSTLLTKASIENIVGHLSDTTNGLTAAFSATAKENAFTDEEWAELIAEKPNWNISLGEV